MLSMARLGDDNVKDANTRRENEPWEEIYERKETHL